MKTLAPGLMLAVVLGLAPAVADAQPVGVSDQPGWSPEGYALSFGVGAYKPDPGSDSFDLVYPGDNGPILLAEFDLYLYRIPFIGPIGIGIQGGWSAYSGSACRADSPPGSCVASSDSAKFTLFPLNAIVALRIDALARKTPVPIVFTGKVGYNTVFFKEAAGAKESRGRSHGFGWGVQIALELNFVNPRRANALDEDFGINSSFFFFELAGSDANNRAPVGDKFYFTGGVGLTF
ncbi:MAG: MXAN_2562 family outer membrane beta-barrel protein [Polyangiales bacterium]